jgi:hypothetical protein
MTDPGVIFKDRLDARVAPAPAPPPPAPAGEPAVGVPVFEDPVVNLITEVNEMLLGLIEDQRKHFELKIAKLETKIATLGGSVNTLEAKSSRGPRGPTGPRGEPAAKIVSWKVNTFRFDAAPVMSDGTEGPPLDLRELVTILARRAVAEAAKQ